jgi:hypothetical protein
MKMSWSQLYATLAHAGFIPGNLDDKGGLLIPEFHKISVLN